MPTIIGPGAGNLKTLKETQELLRQLNEAKDQNLAERHEELLEAIKEITSR